MFGRKQCENEAVWIEHEIYEEKEIKGIYESALCEDCYRRFLPREGPSGWKHV